MLEKGCVTTVDEGSTGRRRLEEQIGAGILDTIAGQLGLGALLLPQGIKPFADSSEFFGLRE